MGKIVKEVGVTAWKKWFAWRPVTDISGNRQWLSRIYHRKKAYFLDGIWMGEKDEFATLFDVLKDDEHEYLE
jgi:hypothetical protein